MPMLITSSTYSRFACSLGTACCTCGFATATGLDECNQREPSRLAATMGGINNSHCMCCHILLLIDDSSVEIERLSNTDQSSSASVPWPVPSGDVRRGSNVFILEGRR